MPRVGQASAAALLVASLAAPALTGPTLGTDISSGTRVYGAVDSAADRDVFFLEAPRGARLAVTVKALGKGGLLPTFELTDPDGAAVNVSAYIFGESTSAVSMPSFPVLKTGVHAFSLEAFLGTTGDYLATFVVQVDTKIAQTVVVPAGGTVSVPLPAWDGVQATLKAAETGGPALASLHLADPDGAALEGTEAARKGSSLSLKAVLASGTGAYAFVLVNGGDAATTVSLKGSVKIPKARKVKLRLAAEPRPASMSPGSGRDGTAFTISGTGLVAAGRVLFDGQYEATEVSLAPGGDLTGRAPVCPASDAGLPATVVVVNPDGQFGDLPQRFNFVGIPSSQYALPMVCVTAGGTTISLHGVGFRPGLTVLFGGVPATDIRLLNGGDLACRAPAHASEDVDIVVVDEYGRAGTPLPGFQYADPPQVSGATPDSAPSFGGRTVVLTGSEFVRGDRIFVGGVEATGVAVGSRTSLSFVVPPAPAGNSLLEVRDPLGRSWQGTGILTLSPSFQEVTATAIPAPPFGGVFPGASVAFGDVNGDGRQDIVLATPVPSTNSASGQKDPGLRFLVNGGTGRFTDGTASLSPSFNRPGDYGQADALAVGDLDSGAAEVLISRATPLRSADAFVTSYGYTCYYALGSQTDLDRPTEVATRLLAHNGSALADATDTNLVEPYSTPARGLGERWQAAATALGDLDGDGAKDLLLVGAGRIDYGTVNHILWTYTKTSVYSYYYGYYYIYTVDKGFIYQDTVQVGSTRTLINDGGGHLAYGGWPPYPALASDGRTILDDFTGNACAVGDIDGDGAGDAVILSSSTTRQEAFDGSLVTAPGLRVLRGDPWGGLSFDPAAIPAGYAASHPGSPEFWQGEAVALGDLDGDGDLDLVVGRNAISEWRDTTTGAWHLAPALRIFRNDGSGNFTEDTAGFLAGDLFLTGGDATVLGARALKILDLDGDGSLDLVLVSREVQVPDTDGGKGYHGLLTAGKRSGVRVFLNDGAGHLADATADRVAPAVNGFYLGGDALDLADADGNGTPDLVISTDLVLGTGVSTVRLLLTR